MDLSESDTTTGAEPHSASASVPRAPAAPPLAAATQAGMPLNAASNALVDARQRLDAALSVEMKSDDPEQLAAWRQSVTQAQLHLQTVSQAFQTRAIDAVTSARASAERSLTGHHEQLRSLRQQVEQLKEISRQSAARDQEWREDRAADFTKPFMSSTVLESMAAQNLVGSDADCTHEFLNLLPAAPSPEEAAQQASQEPIYGGTPHVTRIVGPEPPELTAAAQASFDTLTGAWHAQRGKIDPKLDALSHTKELGQSAPRVNSRQGRRRLYEVLQRQPRLVILEGQRGVSGPRIAKAISYKATTSPVSLTLSSHGAIRGEAIGWNDRAVAAQVALMGDHAHTPEAQATLKSRTVLTLYMSHLELIDDALSPQHFRLDKLDVQEGLTLSPEMQLLLPAYRRERKRQELKLARWLLSALRRLESQGRSAEELRRAYALHWLWRIAQGEVVVAPESILFAERHIKSGTAMAGLIDQILKIAPPKTPAQA